MQLIAPIDGAAVPAEHGEQLIVPYPDAYVPAEHGSQLGDPGCDEWFPWPHDVHACDPSAELVPASQGVQFCAPPAENVPAGHVLHIVWPGCDVNVPPVQLLHDDFPMYLLIVPGKQSVHAPAPLPENVPAPHCEHVDDPGGAYVPGLQTPVQFVAPVPDVLPPGHGGHSFAVEKFAVNVPAVHGVQLYAACFENVPGPHGVHEFVDPSENVPASQFTHDPICNLVPGGHDPEQLDDPYPDNVPFGQALQLVNPADAANVPGVHGVHCASPSVAAMYPGKHFVQLLDPSAAALPALQILHCVVFQKYPPTQKHVVAPALLVLPPVHALHLLDPGNAENVPALHGVHVAAVVVFANVPA